MQYITAKEASIRWELTVRRVQDLCRNHEIHGAVRWGRDWMIPVDAPRPSDRRRKDVIVQAVADNAQLPRKNPGIIFSNLYHIPGTADAVADAMEDRPFGAKLFRSHLAYMRGDVDTAIRLAQELLDGDCGHDLQLGCGIILAVCAVTLGNRVLWRQAEQTITTAPCHNSRDKMAVDFWLGAAQCEIRETRAFPIWFTRGSFDVLPGDSFPCARFYYLRYLYLVGHEYALGHHGQPDAQSRMGVIPYVAEPLIAQNRKEGAIMSEIFSRLICASAYHDMGNASMAIHHLDIAISLALPDKLFMPLAEYRRQMDFLMDERLQVANPEAAAQVKKLNLRFLDGWTVVHNEERGRRVSNQLTTREREVAKHAAFGLSNKEIADRLNISVNTVKQSLRTAMDKTGALRRSELYHYI